MLCVSVATATAGSITLSVPGQEGRLAGAAVTVVARVEARAAGEGDALAVHILATMPNGKTLVSGVRLRDRQHFALRVPTGERGASERGGSERGGDERGGDERGEADTFHVRRAGERVIVSIRERSPLAPLRAGALLGPAPAPIEAAVEAQEPPVALVGVPVAAAMPILPSAMAGARLARYLPSGLPEPARVIDPRIETRIDTRIDTGADAGSSPCGNRGIAPRAVE
ncbi:MAG: hypothetical protein AAF677_02100 [Pseudomonadota bacterium]